MKIEQRALHDTELRVDPGGSGTPPKITGTAVVYGALSDPMKTSRGTTFRERVMPGAFGDLGSADVMGRYNHELNLGRTKSGTMKLADDPASLKYEIDPPDTAQTNHVVTGINRGDIDGSSFAFRTLRDDWKTENGQAVREIHQATLHDVGPVDFPAYGVTAAPGNQVAMRSADMDERSIDAAVEKLHIPNEQRSAGFMRQSKCRAQHYSLWAIEPAWFAGAVEQVKSGITKAADDEDGDYADPELYDVTDGIAVIEISGAIMKGRSKYGGTSSVDVRAAVREAVQDDSVQAILLHIDSPGGTVSGTAELAADVAAANGKKPVHTHFEDLGASAAYWIGSQAQRVTATATSEIGSIGTVMQLADTSGAYEQEGIKVYTLSTGAFKGAGFDGNPVTTDQLAYFQSRVDDINAHFIAGVKAGRKMPVDDVRQIADGRVYSAKDAIGLDLIDDIGSFDDAMKGIKKAAADAAGGNRSSNRTPNLTARLNRRAKLI